MSRTGSGASGSHEDAPPCRTKLHHTYSPPVIPGLQICSDCRDQLENDLVELPGWYDSSADYLDFRSSRGTDRRRADALVSVRSEILSTLGSWCDTVAEERGVLPPNELDIRQRATFLIIHFTWLTAHHAVPDLVDKLAGLTEAVRTVVRPDAT